MTSVLTAVVVVVGATLLVSGVIRLLMVPFALVYEGRWRRRRDDAFPAGTIFDSPPLVSVVVPAYNEAVVIDNCVRSIVRSRYPRYEVLCVDDGSSDDTFDRMRRLADELPGVSAMTQDNAGKGAALNTGITHARGSVLLLVDADGVFGPDTITQMLRSFRSDRVGAVCGNDRPVNLDRVQTRFQALIGHLGTGLMRRALDEMHCLPVVSGNIGAFRRDVLERTGLLRVDTIGEDLELTWRVYRAGYRIAFAPRALVHAESPSTLHGLWKQRVRWARGLVQATRLHWRMIGSLRFGTFGPFLAFNTLTQVVGPFLQVLAVVALAVLAGTGDLSAVPLTFWAWVLFLGLPTTLALLVLSLVLDRALRDVRFGWTLPLWPLYSTAMTAVMLRAVWLEARGAENRWNKLDRTGTISIAMDDDAGPPAAP